jgi:hypothetical protein
LNLCQDFSLYFCYEFKVGTIDTVVPNISIEHHAKIGNIWSNIRHPFRFYNFQPVLNISENSETMWEPPVGDPVRTAVPNRADGLLTTATTALPRPWSPLPNRLARL